MGALPRDQSRARLSSDSGDEQLVMTRSELQNPLIRLKRQCCARRRFRICKLFSSYKGDKYLPCLVLRL